MFRKSQHQQKQIDIINAIEKQSNNNSLNLSTVSPVADYNNDPRLCLTSVHFPRQELIDQVESVVKPLKAIDPNHYYYPPNSLHITIKNIRIISDPPNFDTDTIAKVAQVFDNTISQFQPFSIYYYRLLVFPNNLSLVGTTDPQLDNIILSLDQSLCDVGIPDDKKYANNKYFFSNITLMRFTRPVDSKMKEKIKTLSETIRFSPYVVDTVSLICSNASLSKCTHIKTWQL